MIEQKPEGDETQPKRMILEETIYPCAYPECGKLFKSRFALKRHSLVHSKEKLHTCECCGKHFALPQYLREHMNTHTKDTPYVCGVGGCEKRFRQAGKLSLHRRTHAEYQLKHYNYHLNPRVGPKGMSAVPSAMPSAIPSSPVAPRAMEQSSKPSQIESGQASPQLIAHEAAAPEHIQKLSLADAAAETMATCVDPLKGNTAIPSHELADILSRTTSVPADEMKKSVRRPSDGLKMPGSRKMLRVEVSMMQCLPWLELPFPVYVTPILPPPHSSPKCLHTSDLLSPFTF